MTTVTTKATTATGTNNNNNDVDDDDDDLGMKNTIKESSSWNVNRETEEDTIISSITKQQQQRRQQRRQQQEQSAIGDTTPKKLPLPPNWIALEDAEMWKDANAQLRQLRADLKCEADDVVRAEILIDIEGLKKRKGDMANSLGMTSDKIGDE